MREKLIDIVETYADFLDWDTKEDVVDSIMDLLATDNNVGDKLSPTEWIPVTERLPKRRMQCVCRYVFGNDTQGFFQVLDYYAADAQPHFQHELGGSGMRVTHWMPLPEPPKGV